VNKTLVTANYSQPQAASPVSETWTRLHDAIPNDESKLDGTITADKISANDVYFAAPVNDGL
jgi:hypothetical protein